MGKFHDKRFPGESDAYRTARDELLEAEMGLRRHIENVAALRRKLPLGGEMTTDYVFQEGAQDLADTTVVRDTPLSSLFAGGKLSLILYSFMYAPDADEPCAMCTAILDSFNGSAPHVNDRVNFAVAAKAPVQEIRDWARLRSWHGLRLLSSEHNTYNADYLAEDPDGGQLPAINVFRRTEAGVFHTYNAELLYSPADTGQHMRHADLVWPLWNLFDLTPDGRGTDWSPRFTYD